jgi:hypothetical protein
MLVICKFYVSIVTLHIMFNNTSLNIYCTKSKTILKPLESSTYVPMLASFTTAFIVDNVD